MFGSALTIASFMKLIHAMFLGRPAKDFSSIKEASPSMLFPIIILAVICFIFGVFAFIFPIPIFITASTGAVLIYLGSWNPIIVTGLILISIICGIFMYIILRPAKGYRTVSNFVGGEDPEKMERISGTDFYDTIKDIKALSFIYKKEEAKTLDIYDQTKNFLAWSSRILKRAHNGILPTYMVWCLIGMIAIFFVLFFR